MVRVEGDTKGEKGSILNKEEMPIQMEKGIDVEEKNGGKNREM